MIRTNMGPRGRRFRNREFRPGIMIGLLSLFFGGWIVISVLGGLLGAGVMTVGALLSAVRHFFIHVVGGAFTHGFTEVEHPLQELSNNNIVPGFRLGAIFEYDYKSGFGWFFDLGAEAFLDRYDGQMPMTFPLDINAKLSLGIIYHFPLR